MGLLFGNGGILSSIHEAFGGGNGGLFGNGGLIHSLINPTEASSYNKKSMDSVVNSQNANFQNAANQYGNYINTNTGLTGNNTAYNEGKKKGADLTRLQSNGAASQTLGAVTSAGGTRGRAADAAGQASAQTFANNYAQNVQNQQNVANQQLANQLNAQGTLMGAQLTNDQAQYNQGMNNLKQGKKDATGPLGWLTDAFSDGKLKDSVKVGLDGESDLRMAHYKRCGEKLKQMNPHKWQDLKWEAK